MGGGAAAGAMAGGLLGGPVGMIFGGAAGFICGSGAAYNNMKVFKLLWEVLEELNREDKRKLVEIGKRVLQEKGINLAYEIIGMYGGQVARTFLGLVYEEFSGVKLQ